MNSISPSIKAIGIMEQILAAQSLVSASPDRPSVTADTAASFHFETKRSHSINFSTKAAFLATDRELFNFRRQQSQLAAALGGVRRGKYL
jgi:hypothetical protein